MSGPLASRVLLLWALCLASAAACSSPSPAPTAPTPPAPPTPPSIATSASLADVLSGAVVPGVVASGAGISGGPSDAAGRISIVAEASLADPRAVTFTHTSVVTRQLLMKVPGADVAVSLIPAAFDLGAFDELLRVTQLQRWRAAPPLRVQSRVLQFTSVSAAEATGIDEVMADNERAGLEADLTWALPQLTGNQFPAFASITRETVAEGASTSVLNTGVITVARYKGLTAATGYWGYARWQYRSDGTVTSGTVMLDRDFEKSGSIYRRSLRAHELGHALGYTHVTLRPSVMNSAARIEPNAFDKEATWIAFQRPPGNRRPDADPSGISANVASASAVWSVGAGGRGEGDERPPSPGSRCAPGFGGQPSQTAGWLASRSCERSER